MKLTKASIICLLTALMLVLCACGGNQAAPAPAAEVPEPTEAPLTKEDVMGVLEGQVYTNEFIGIGCELNDEWSYFDADQLGQLSGAVADALPEDVSQVLDNGGVLYSMYAAADGGLRTVGIVFERLNVLNSIVLDESSYIDASLPQVDQALQTAGLNVLICEHSTATFAGAERDCIHTEGEASGVTFYQNTIPIKCGNYMAVCTISCYQTNTLDEIGAAFYTLQ